MWMHSLGQCELRSFLLHHVRLFSSLFISLSPPLFLSRSLCSVICGNCVFVYICNVHFDSSWRRVACTSTDLLHTEKFFLSPGLLLLLGCSWDSLFGSRTSHNTSLFFLFPRPPFSLLLTDVVLLWTLAFICCGIAFLNDILPAEH